MLYVTAVLCMAALVASAFYLPGAVFEAQDRRLSEDIVLEEQEAVDVARLTSSAYELSLYNRMSAFAEGLESGRTYYVSELELDVTQDMEDWLKNSAGRILEDNVFTMALMDAALLSNVFYKDLTVEKWKQYVIYSDDYAQGVNFNIWYLELAAYDEEDYKNFSAEGMTDGYKDEEEEVERVKLLMDAETYTLYGIWTSHTIKMSEKAAFQYAFSGTLWNYSTRRYISVDNWWSILCYYYQALTVEEIETYLSVMESSDLYTYTETDSDIIAYRESRQVLPDNMGWYFSDENHFTLLLPFEGRHLDFTARLVPDEEGAIYWFPEVVFGIEEICQLIPEFQGERW